MNEHDFDELVRGGLQAEASEEQLARLEQFWRHRSAAQRRVRRRHVAAIAASLLVLALAGMWLTSRPTATRPGRVVVKPAPAPAAPRNSAVVQDATDEPKSTTENRVSAGRPATAYERLMFTMSAAKSADAEATRLTRSIDEAIERLRSQPGADAQQAVPWTRGNPAAAEPLLLMRLAHASGDHRLPLLKLLAVCGTERSTPALLRAARDESLRDEALAALEHIVGLEGLAGAARKAADGAVRTAIYRRLLEADSPVALVGYLSLVSDGAFRAEALSAADKVAQPPLETLFTLLNDERKAVRISAAVVLGHVNGPDVTAALIALVTENPSVPSEAWVALLACRGESADQFLAGASRHPRMLGRVNNARLFWAQMTQ